MVRRDNADGCDRRYISDRVYASERGSLGQMENPRENGPKATALEMAKIFLGTQILAKIMAMILQNPYFKFHRWFETEYLYSKFIPQSCEIRGLEKFIVLFTTNEGNLVLHIYDLP